MRLSAPIYYLKRRAKALSRRERIPLHEALDRIAVAEGFNGWSLLAAQASAAAPSTELLARLNPGDLLLLGARPGHGKTMMSVKLMVEAMRAGHPCVFFSLEYNAADILGRFRDIGEDPVTFAGQSTFDDSDTICADYIMERLESFPRGTLVVIDFLQLLDQKRENPELQPQVRALKSFASDQGFIIVFISQIHRSYDPSAKPCPGLEAVRLPNPLDLRLFNKTRFLNDTVVRFEPAS